MIKSLLFFCACILAMSGYAQKNVLVSDTTYESVDSGRSFSVLNTDSHSYNSFCQDTLYISGNLQNPINPSSVLSLRTYSADGTIHTITDSRFDTATQTYIFNSRSTYLHSQDKLLDSSIVETWRNGMWQLNSLNIGINDTRGNLLTYIRKQWDTILMTYTNNFRYLYSYNIAGKNTYFEYQIWNTQSNSWRSSRKDLYSFDIANHLIASSSTSQENSTGSYSHKDTVDYSIKANGLIDSSISMNISKYLGMPDTSIQKEIRSYDNFTGKLKQIAIYSTGNTLYDNINIRSYYYDTTDNFYTDSVISTHVFLPNPKGTAFLGVSVNRSRYNTDSTLAERIIIYYYYSYDFFNNYRRVVYHYASCQSILPVTLLSFTGEMKNTDALLHWAATNEGNALHYVVQRSTDGVHFTTICNVMPVGRDAYQNKYDYTDKDVKLLQSPKVFYRLAQTDKNGAVTYTKIVTLYVSTNKLLVALSPNPVQNMLTVYSPIAIAGATICVADVNGRQFYTSLQNLGAGSRLMIDMSAYPKGMYLVTIRSDKDRQMFKVVK